MNIMTREPALTMGLIQVIITAAVAFGLKLTAEQCAAILSLSAALLSIVTRQLVTPTVKK